ncbi:brachyurin-like [Condylostylus longicornis]|uniref:brachyurin-like n=1 Tax=Condylostylus longicornis TaxID=2530218 RepID=UPI00244E4CED|nr:brachyurin-like [Condylostylus longicornis]
MKIVETLSILFVITLVANCFKIEPRIISGKHATKGQLPWQVLIKKVGLVWCGGSIIADEWVLTAAHCTKGEKSLELVFGIIHVKEPGISMKSNQFTEHPQYNPSNLNYDISLIKLPQKLTFNNFIKPITLNKNPDQFTGQLCTISGWGYMSDEDLIHSDNLLYAKVNVITRDNCIEFYGEDYVTDDTICTLGSNLSDESICSGDSGGALVIDDGSNPIQIGINSFVADERCTEKIPAGYIRVSSFINFIESVIKKQI